MEDGFIVLQIQLDGRQTDRQKDIQSFSHKEGRGTGSAIQYNNKWIKLEDRQELVIGYQETGKGEFII